jgi:hypothetical protein
MTPIGILISLAEEEGCAAIMEACKGGLYRLLEQGLLGAADIYSGTCGHRGSNYELRAGSVL